MARGDQQAEQQKGEEGQSSVIVERGENTHNPNPKKIVEVKDKWVSESPWTLELRAT